MIEGLVFDLDGVLLDSFRAHYDFVELKAREHRIHVPSIQQAKDNIASPMQNWLRSFGFPEEIIPQMLEEYRKYMVSVDIPFYEGIPELLIEFKQKYKFGIASSNNRKTIDAQLKKARLDSIFGAIVGLEDVSNPKPHPEMVRAIMKRLGVCPEEVIFVGDMRIDAIAARRSKVRAAMLTTGSNSYAELRREKPYRIFRNIKELRTII